MTAPATSPPPDLPARRWRAWLWLAPLLAPGLWLFTWSAQDPAAVAPWKWIDGFLWPAPSLVLLWLSAAILFAILSGIAWLLHTTPAGAKTLQPWASLLLILAAAAVARCALTPPAAPLYVSFDLLTLLLLTTALRLARRSVWWVSLYALHPLVLLAPAPLATLAALVLASLAIATHFLAARRPASNALTLLAVALPLALAFHLDHTAPLRVVGPFIDLFARLFWNIPPATALILSSSLLAAALLAVLSAALLRRWPPMQTASHALMAYLLLRPEASAAPAAIALAAAVLYWNRAAWALSFTALAFTAVPLSRELTGQPNLPDWLSTLLLTPPLILQIHQFLTPAPPPELSRPLLETAAPLPPTNPE